MSDTKFWFGKHSGKELCDVPSGYLKWMVENMDAVPQPKYRFKQDGVTPLTADEVEAMTERMKNFLSAAEDELLNREQA